MRWHARLRRTLFFSLPFSRWLCEALLLDVLQRTV